MSGDRDQEGQGGWAEVTQSNKYLDVRGFWSRGLKHQFTEMKYTKETDIP